MSKSLTVAMCIAFVCSLALNGYLYQLVQKGPEIIYVEPPVTEIASADTEESLFVYVSGLVAKPGVYVLPSGSRTYMALEMAGGALPEANLTSINLARVLFDGEQLNVYSQSQTPTEAVGVTSPVVATDQRININTASQQELEALPGIGPVKAEAIINYRTQNGPFRKPEDIMQVTGIAEKTYDGLKDRIRVN